MHSTARQASFLGLSLGGCGQARGLRGPPAATASAQAPALLLQTRGRRPPHRFARAHGVACPPGIWSCDPNAHVDSAPSLRPQAVRLLAVSATWSRPSRLPSPDSKSSSPDAELPQQRDQQGTEGIVRSSPWCWRKVENPEPWCPDTQAPVRLDGKS